MATNLTTENIKTISQFPELPAADIASDDVILVQDVSENAYKKTFLQAILNWIDKGINQKAFDIAHPVYDPATGHGDIYLQFPSAYDMDTHTFQYNTATPMELYNHNGITSTWVELDYDGAFFRANGGFAENFGAGKQAEGLPNITADITRVYAWSDVDGTLKYGAFTFEDSTNYHITTGASGYFKKIKFNAADSNSIYGLSDHVTPTNYTVRVWLRTA